MVAITGIVVLEGIALLCGVNGMLYTLAIVAISGLGGYEIRDIFLKMKGGGGIPPTPPPSVTP